MPATISGSQNGTVGLINALTVASSTSGTTVDFTGIPSGAKRITVMFNGVSLSGTADLLVQIGSGSFTSTGYVSAGSECTNNGTPNTASSTTGFIVKMGLGTRNLVGCMIICNITGSTWVEMYSSAFPTDVRTGSGGGSVALSGALDRVRFTTSNGTDTFDAGTANVFYE